MDDRYIKLVEEIRTTLADSTTEESLSRFVALARQYDIPLSDVRLMVKGELNRKKYQEIWGKENVQNRVVTDIPQSFVAPIVEKEKTTIPPIENKAITNTKPSKEKTKKYRKPLLIVLGVLLLAILAVLAFQSDLFQKEQPLERITNASDLQGSYEGKYLKEDRKITFDIQTLTPDNQSNHFDFEGTISVSRTFRNAAITGTISKNMQEISFDLLKRGTVNHKVLSKGMMFEKDKKIIIIAEDESWRLIQIEN